MGVIGSVEGFAGAVSADEPRAATIARDVLGANGSAVDAAVALYFALAVTLPSSAALGGGGVCLVHDAEKSTVEALDFLPRSAAGGGVAVPASARGMAALHARYGRVRWALLLTPAENLARFGTPMSRALAREAATAEEKIKSSPELARVFLTEDGRLIDEGEPLKQEELANVLSQIRQKGAGEIYSGVLARTLAEAAQSVGAPLTLDDLRWTVPQWRETVQLPWGDHELHFPPPPAAGGLLTAELVSLLSEGRDYAGTATGERPHLFAEASKRAFIERARWMAPEGGSREPVVTLLAAERAEALMRDYDSERAAPMESLAPGIEGRLDNPWAASFVVADRDGMAIACTVTMNDLFGTGRMAPGTGLLLAAAPDGRGRGATALGPVILANKHNGGFFYAAAASGGPAAATAMAQVLLRALAAGEPLATAMAAKRLHHNAMPDVLFFEEGEDDGVLADLARRGHKLEVGGLLGRVQAIWCPESIQSEPGTCQVQSDPRVDGLAVVLSE